MGSILLRLPSTSINFLVLLASPAFYTPSTFTPQPTTILREQAETLYGLDGLAGMLLDFGPRTETIALTYKQYLKVFETRKEEQAIIRNKGEAMGATWSCQAGRRWARARRWARVQPGGGCAQRGGRGRRAACSVVGTATRS